MATGPTVGRVLLASLHQAIAEVLPARLGFYERWLTSDSADRRDVAIESFIVMLDYLEQEGRPYNAITARAGHYAAIRSFRKLFVLDRAYLRLLPRRLRARKAIRLVVQMLPALYRDVRVELTRRGGTAFIGIDGSPFCDTRVTNEPPSCGFVSSAITTYLELLNLRPAVRVTRCRASGASSCLVVVLPDQTRNLVPASALLGLSDDRMTPAAGEFQVEQPQPEAEPLSSPPGPGAPVETVATPDEEIAVAGRADIVIAEAPEAGITDAGNTVIAPPEKTADDTASTATANEPEPHSDAIPGHVFTTVTNPLEQLSALDADEDPEAPWHRL
jgi:hypothetical protein